MDDVCPNESLALVPNEPLFADAVSPLRADAEPVGVPSTFADSSLAAIEAASLDVRAGDAGIAVLTGGGCADESECDFGLGAATFVATVETTGAADGTGVADVDAETEAEEEVGVDADDGTGADG